MSCNAASECDVAAVQPCRFTYPAENDKQVGGNTTPFHRPLTRETPASIVYMSAFGLTAITLALRVMLCVWSRLTIGILLITFTLGYAGASG